MLTTSHESQNSLAWVPCFLLLRTLKQQWRWLWKADVQQWDTCPKLTELRFGHLTEPTRTHKSKSNTLIPKTNSPTSWRKAVSLLKNWTIFSVCSTSWTTPCFLVAFSAQLTTLKPCRRGWYRRKSRRRWAGGCKIETCANSSLERHSISLQQRWVRAHLKAGRWILTRTTHQALKCGTQILTRTQTRG